MVNFSETEHDHGYFFAFFVLWIWIFVPNDLNMVFQILLKGICRNLSTNEYKTTNIGTAIVSLRV